MHRYLKYFGIIIAAISTASVAAADEWEFGGEISTEIRYFPSEPQFPGQFEHWQPSLTLQPDIRWESDDGKHQLVMTPFARIDAQDNERTHIDLREGYYRYISDNDWTLLIGAAKVFWGTAESRHLVDIINQTDSVEDIDEEDKLGQPMIKLSLLKEWGQLDLFVMSGFRTRTFPGADGRLRFPLPVDTEKEIFESDANRGAVDYAARYSNFFGNWDVGLSVFHGTSREPRFAVLPTNDGLAPVYDRITQGGLDVQYTAGAWLWKGEAIVRRGHGSTFFAGVAGVEYTLYQIFGRSWDLGLLAEYLYDGRDEGFVLEPFGVTSIAPATAFQNDVFTGARLALNDTQDTSLLAGVSVDADDQSMSMLIEAQRRIGQNWTVELESRLFFNIDPGNIADAFRDDDVLTFRLTRYY
ncbi:MAG: hypothetical protein DHS20C05_06820 [Hyphococcus sp.]|nr:MAG: hypothetical protein DHS20C05_06820 [Marinicaulis sp.]